MSRHFHAVTLHLSALLFNIKRSAQYALLLMRRKRRTVTVSTSITNKKKEKKKEAEK